jgi:hypothetical protein
MMIMLAQDILDKLNRDFEDSEEAALALSVLADFVEENQELSVDRILRCIVFVANGDLDLLDKAIELAKIDYRDLIVWAEYDEKRERIRDLSLPFSEEVH